MIMETIAAANSGRKLDELEDYFTGYSDRLFAEKITLWEDEAFLDKPCSVKGLLQAVSLLLQGRVDLTSP